ncbi:MAG TPA: UDP-N-acetylglucosamine 2-epimerase (non-hydrolyzing), partial [Anaerolineales bacterium]|nr:UDP-N-acetylglucosamine 2-epimerase (non-hydrolyzing) [Anaerolineales bacterium]
MICTIVGARPNFVKMAPIIHEINRRGMPQLFVHTGQHYDAKMSTVFFDELGMPRPDVYLGVGSGSHAEQTAKVMMAFEGVLREHSPVMVVVAGDVNSTLACALTASKLHVPVAHVEAGLRSFDREMPEEINRILTDHISDLLFITEPSGEKNLAREGIASTKIFFVGNTMIDSLHTHLSAALARRPWEAFALPERGYGVVTLHRPSNVDEEKGLRAILSALEDVGERWPLLFPAHPRTVARMAEWGLAPRGVRVVEPLGYLDFLGLMAKAQIVLTDSGGIQEETTALGVPCITIRENTERPATIDEGSNLLAGTKREGILAAVARLERDAFARGNRVPKFWDGHAA